MIFQMWTGIDFVTAQAPLVLVTLGYSSESALYASIGVGALIFLSTIVSVWLADKTGRKPLLLAGGIGMSFSLLGITIVLAGWGTSAPWIGPFCLSMVYIFTFAFGATWGPIGWLYVTEILTLETRTAGQAITSVVNMLIGWLLAEFFLTMLCSMKWGVFVMFTVSIVIITVSTEIIYPETARVPIEECPLLFKKHWVWKKYANSEDEDSKLSPAEKSYAVDEGKVQVVLARNSDMMVRRSFVAGRDSERI
jgi:MFS family permease